MPSKQLVVLSAPSGAGKTTVAKHLLATFPSLRFSVSATTRPQRPGEVNGRDYFFLTKEDFAKKIEHNDLLEYEMIFGNLYGTLRSEIQKSMDKGDVVIFDVDVKGALSLRNAFPKETLLLFIAPPCMETLEQRLRNRHTETSEQIAQRLERASMEMQSSLLFDAVIINDNLETTLQAAEDIVRNNIL